MLYLTMLIVTTPEVLEDLENDQINPWPKRNPMTLNRIMLNVGIKWAIDLRS